MGRRVHKKVYDWDSQAGDWEATTSEERKFIYDDWRLLLELEGGTGVPPVDEVVRMYTWGRDLSGKNGVAAGPGTGRLGNAGYGAPALQSAGGIGGLLSVYDADAEDDYVYFYDAGGNVGQLVDLGAAGAGTSVVAHYEFLGGKPGGTPVFPMPGSEKVVRMLRHDLKAAGIPYETASGVVDFHSLRSTCLSWLAAAGVPLKTLQTFARHSTPVLTMNVYTHNLHGSLAGAAGLLPDLPEAGHEALRATGTDSAVAGAPATGDATGGHTGGKTGRKTAPDSSRPCAATHGSTSEPHTPRVSQTPCFQGETSRTEVHESEREWMGIEPTRDSLYCPSTALKAAEPTRCPDTPSAAGILSPRRRTVKARRPQRAGRNRTRHA